MWFILLSFYLPSFILVGKLNRKVPSSRAGVAEWYTALFSPHQRSWVWTLNLHQCLWTHLQVHGLKRLGCHADHKTVSRCCTRGESGDHTGKKVHKGSTLALKPWADFTRSSKQGYQWPHEKDLRPPKIYKKKERKKDAIWLANVVSDWTENSKWNNRIRILIFQIERDFHVLMDLLTTSKFVVRGNYINQPSILDYITWVLWLITLGELYQY